MNTQTDLSPKSLIVGCWQLDDRSWTSIPEADIERALDTYLALGVNQFDTADIYGRSERILGQLLKGRDCTILTKAVFFDNVPTPNQIRSKVETSLRNLRRETLDYVQVHWHNPALDFAPTLTALTQFIEQGKIRHLGVTNFNTAMLERALQYAPIRVHQVQYSLIDRRVEQSMQALCQAHNIGLLAYGPLAGGFLSQKFRGMSHLPNTPDHARSFYYSNMVQAHGGWSPVVAMLETLAEVARKYDKSVSQVALNWVKQQPSVLAVIAGFTRDRLQIHSNATALDWDLDPADVQLLSQRSTALFKQPGDVYSYER